MINVLECSPTCLKLSDMSELVTAVATNNSTYEFIERFAFKIKNCQTNSSAKSRQSSQRKVMVEPLSILELFLIRDKLKGKKKPIKKKNHDAQQFASRSEGIYFLDETKHFFTNFNIIKPGLEAVSNLSVCKSELLNDICFILACEPSFFFGNRADKKPDYFLRTYESLLEKRKIYKTTSKFIIFVNRESPHIEITPDHSVLWFSNPVTTISN